MTPRILNLQVIKSNFNPRIMEFNLRFYQLLNMFRKFEKNLCSMDSAVHLSHMPPMFYPCVVPKFMEIFLNNSRT